MWTLPRVVVAGETTWIWVASIGITLCAAIEPKRTPPVASRLLNPVPVTATAVPPAIVPVAIEIAVMVGTATYVYFPYNEIAEAVAGFTTVTSTDPVPAGATAVI